MIKKLLCKRGETLTETLVSVLIIAISAAMLATMVTVSVNINIKANTAIAAFYLELSDAEEGATMSGAPTAITVAIDNVQTDVDVIYYGKDTSSLATYKKKP